MEIHECVRAYCAEHGMTEKGFEEMCGIGRHIVWRWRRLGEKPRLETILRIMRATGTDISDWVKAS